MVFELKKKKLAGHYYSYDYTYTILVHWTDDAYRSITMYQSRRLSFDPEEIELLDSDQCWEIISKKKLKSRFVQNLVTSIEKRGIKRWKCVVFDEKNCHISSLRNKSIDPFNFRRRSVELLRKNSFALFNSPEVFFFLPITKKNPGIQFSETWETIVVPQVNTKTWELLKARAFRITCNADFSHKTKTCETFVLLFCCLGTCT